MPLPLLSPLRLVALALWVVGCRPAAPERQSDSSPTLHAPRDTQHAPVTASDSLRLSLNVPALVRAAQPVPITLRLENVGGRPLDLYLRGRTIAFDVVVTRASGDTVWRRLQDEIIPAIIQLRVLAPGEALELKHDWDQRDNRGNLVGPGEYVVRGSILTDAPTALESAPAPLRIAPS